MNYIKSDCNLQNDMMKYFREDLHRRLLSADFKKQVDGLQMLQKVLFYNILNNFHAFEVFFIYRNLYKLQLHFSGPSFHC